MSLGNSLFNARKRSGLSQEDVAEKLGVSRQTIYHTHGIARNSNNLNLKERAIWQLKQKLKFQMNNYYDGWIYFLRRQDGSVLWYRRNLLFVTGARMM